MLCENDRPECHSYAVGWIDHRDCDDLNFGHDFYFRNDFYLRIHFHFWQCNDDDHHQWRHFGLTDSFSPVQCVIQFGGGGFDFLQECCIQ